MPGVRRSVGAGLEGRRDGVLAFEAVALPNPAVEEQLVEADKTRGAVGAPFTRFVPALVIETLLRARRTPDGRGPRRSDDRSDPRPRRTPKGRTLRRIWTYRG